MSEIHGTGTMNEPPPTRPLRIHTGLVGMLAYHVWINSVRRPRFNFLFFAMKINQQFRIILMSDILGIIRKHLVVVSICLLKPDMRFIIPEFIQQQGYISHMYCTIVPLLYAHFV